MAGSQKVFLRIFAIVGDGDDSDTMPDRVPVSGSGRLIPTLATGSGDIAPGPDSINEVRLIESIPFLIVDGMLTYDGKPYIWLPVPTSQWQWRIAFDTVRVGDQFRSLREYAFPLTAATPAQIADPGYPGVNIAQYATGTWEPGTVNLTADAIQQINIMLGRASNAAGDAEQSRDAAAADALTLAQRVAGGAREVKYTSDGKPYFIPESEVKEVELRVDTTVGTRVFLGDVMIHGDTGWRDVNALVHPDWNVTTFHMRRVGSTVNVFVFALNRTANAPDAVMTGANGIPSGFRPLGRPAGVVTMRSNPLGHYGWSADSSSLWVGQTLDNSTSQKIGVGTDITTAFRWHTDDPWPTSLPGTAT